MFDGHKEFKYFQGEEEIDLENNPAAQALMDNIVLGLQEIVGTHGDVVLTHHDFSDIHHPESARIRVFRPDVVLTLDTIYYDDLYLTKKSETGVWHANHSRYHKSSVESGSSVGGSNPLELNMQVLQHYSDLLFTLRSN